MKPFICLHGWQDNASTFDRLIPLLPQQFSYLALDFPGHGKSSWLPRGFRYEDNGNLYGLIEVIKKLKFEKVGLIAHSMGGYVAFIFASVVPELVEMLIVVDIFKQLNLSLSDRLEAVGNSIRNFDKADKIVRDRIKPPSYSVDEMIEKINQSSMGNVSLDSAAHLLKRNIAPSNENGKFYFTRDNRLRLMLLLPFPTDLMLQMAKQIEIPVLFLAASEETPLYTKTSFYNEITEILKKKPKVEFSKIHSDNHYFHINEPEKVSTVVSEFIMKHGKVHRL